MYLRSANRNHTQCSKTWYLMARRRRRAWSIIWMPRRSWQIAGRYGRYGNGRPPRTSSVMSRLRQWGKWLLPSSSWGRPKRLRSVVVASLSATRYQCPFLLRNTSWMLLSVMLSKYESREHPANLFLDLLTAKFMISRSAGTFLDVLPDLTQSNSSGIHGRTGSHQSATRGSAKPTMCIMRQPLQSGKSREKAKASELHNIH
jgi:hypothetical protein